MKETLLNTIEHELEQKDWPTEELLHPHDDHLQIGPIEQLYATIIRRDLEETDTDAWLNINIRHEETPPGNQCYLTVEETTEEAYRAAKLRPLRETGDDNAVRLVEAIDHAEITVTEIGEDVLDEGFEIGAYHTRSDAENVAEKIETNLDGNWDWELREWQDNRPNVEQSMIHIQFKPVADESESEPGTKPLQQH